jgi:hypothetical protein
MSRKVKADAAYNKRFDQTGYQKPPKGEIVHTTETPEAEKERLDYFRGRTPDPIDKDIPKTLVPRQDAVTGDPYLVEVQLRKEAVETSKPKEATVPTGSPRKKKKGFALKQGEQTETVVRLVREHVSVGERFNVNLLYGWFSPTEKDRWYRAYGDQKAAKDKLMKAVTNVAFSGKHLRVVPVSNVPRTWVLEKKSGTSTRGLRMTAPKSARITSKPEVQPLPDVVPVPALPYKLIGIATDGQSLYISKTGVVGTLVFTPVKPG